MEAVDSYIPQPKRDVEKPFIMPVEDVFSISGRGHGGHGANRAREGEGWDEGGDRGDQADAEDVVTGVEMFRKLLDEGLAGDNVGCLCWDQA